MSEKKKNRSNLSSPISIITEIRPSEIYKWFIEEILILDIKSHIEILKGITENENDFIQWPHLKNGLLLWKGSTREERYHKYSDKIKQMAKSKKITLDGRANGPAKAAFEFAEGIQPKRYGSTNKWYCNHLYSGKYPYLKKSNTLHAVKDGNHFTQSAGIVALHPIANAAFDEYPAFAWYLRALAFKKYGYDPDSVFIESNEYGFSSNVRPEIIDGSSTNRVDILY